MTRRETPQAPSHLRPETRKWWSTIVSEWALEPHHLQLLTLAAEALDRAREAREAIERDGAYFPSADGPPKKHPALSIERDAMITHARLMRELNLDGEPAPDVRPPRPPGNR